MGAAASVQRDDEAAGDLARIETDEAPPAALVEADAHTDALTAPDPAAPRGGAARDGGRIQHYELIRELGRGGMGVVHLARDLKLGRLVAIKILTRPGPPQERYLREAQATARCRHENIVVIHEVGVHDEEPYLVFEYLRGQTLQRWMEGRTLAPTRAVEIMVPVVRALVCAHEMEIIHRDLKPANIMLTEEGVTKVLDFGVAKIGAAAELPGDEEIHGPESGQMRTQAGTRLGTLPYMSPEQIAGEIVDHRADIWAVGIILYELVTGDHPLAPLSPIKLELLDDLTVPMPSARARRDDLGPLADIIDRCLLKDREHRTATARQLLQELEAMLPAQRPRAHDTEINLFAGLSAFQETDADRFFGRDHDIASIVTRLRAVPLVAVTGASGAGKSSLVRAGVIPALKRSGEGWEAVVTRPGRQPLAALADVLVSLPGGAPPLRARSHDGHDDGRDEGEGDGRDGIVDRLRAEPGYLGRALRAWATAKLRRLVLFVDQFEELYTLGVSAEERARVLACLGAVADDVTSPLRVILAVRSDFLDRMVEQRAFLDTVSHGLLFLSALDRPGLGEALINPVAACDHRFESPEMVARILDELEATRSPLPLLQFTADKLWARRDRRQRVLTEESLRALGGVSGALASHADAVLASMPAHDARLARAVFLRLVTPERTRALATLGELRQLGRDAEAMDRVLSRLIAARLLAVEGGAGGTSRGEEVDGTVEIVHESLIESWPLLGQWLVESEEDALFLARLRNAALDWERSHHDPGLLWTHQAARDAHAWHQRYKGELAPGEARFLAAVFAETERQKRRRRRRGVGAFAALTLVAIMMSYLAWQQTQASRAATREASAARQVSAFLAEMFEASDPYKAGGNQITARQILDRGAARIETELHDQPEVRARLMHIIGVVYGNLGIYTEATSLLEQALATREQRHGHVHLDVAETEQALADVLVDKLDFARAEALYRQALATRRALLGERHTAVADSMHGLADVLGDQRKFEQASVLARQALALRRELLGEAHPDIAASLHLLGAVLLVDSAHRDEAERMLRESIDMYRKLRGGDGLEMAAPLHILAQSYFLQEDYETAEDLIEQSLAIRRRVLGENHIAVAHGLHQKAIIAQRRGTFDRAESLLQRALDIHRASLDGDRAPTIQILRNLAQLAATRGDYARAETLTRDAIATHRQWRRDDRLFGRLLTDLASTLHAQERYQEAEEAYREALAVHERVGNATSPATVEARANLAALWIETGKLDEAAPLMQALEQVGDGGTESGYEWLPHHVQSVRGAYLSRTGQREQAMELLQQSHAALQKQLGAHDRHTQFALRRLVMLRESTGTPETAAQRGLHRRAITPRRRATESDTSSPVRGRSAL